MTTPELPSAEAQERPFGFLHSFLGVIFVGGIMAIFLAQRITPREPLPTTLPAPIVPQGAVYLAVLGEGKTPDVIGHAAALRLEDRLVVLTSRQLFGVKEPFERAQGLRVIDPEQRVAPPLGEALVLGECRPDGSGDVPNDYALFDLPPAESVGPLYVAEAPPKEGDPLWIVAYAKEGQELTHAEVAEVNPSSYVLYLSEHEVGGWAGAPCLNAQGALVGIVSIVVRGKEAYLVHVTPVERALSKLNAQAQPDVSRPPEAQSPTPGG